MENAEGIVNTVMVREAVGAFHEWKDLQAAVDTLMASGFDRSELSLLASEAAVGEKLGHKYENTSELGDDPAVPRAAFVGRDSLVEGRAFAIGGLGYISAMAVVGGVVASGGALITAIIAAVAAGGAGSAVGALVSRSLGREHADSIKNQLEKGGILLWVRTRDTAHEQSAVDILTTHNAADVHVHDLPASSDPDHDPLADLTPDPFLPNART